MRVSMYVHACEHVRACVCSCVYRSGCMHVAECVQKLKEKNGDTELGFSFQCCVHQMKITCFVMNS